MSLPPSRSPLRGKGQRAEARALSSSSNRVQRKSREASMCKAASKDARNTNSDPQEGSKNRAFERFLSSAPWPREIAEERIKSARAFQGFAGTLAVPLSPRFYPPSSRKPLADKTKIDLARPSQRRGESSMIRVKHQA